MKYSILTLSALVAGFFAGCTEQSQNKAEDAYNSTVDAVSEGGKQAGDAISDTWDSVADYTSDKKDQFVDSLQKSYSGIKAKAEELEGESDKISDKTIAKFDDAGEALEEQLEKAGDASNDAWDSTKDGVRDAWNNLLDAFDEMTAEADVG